MGVFCHPEGVAEGHETSRYETSDVSFPPAPSLCIGKVIYKKVTLIFLCPLEGNAAKRQRVCEGKNGDVTLWRFHSAGSEESQYVPIVETLPVHTDERETMGLYPSCSHLASTIYRLSPFPSGCPDFSYLSCMKPRACRKIYFLFRINK